jgi:small GTP-binding protein
VGDPATGKTSIINQWLYERYIREYQPTIGAAYFTKIHQLSDHLVRLQILDTAGDPNNHSQIVSCLRASTVVFLVFDVTSKESFEALKGWHRLVLDRAHPAFFVIGNKIDLQEARVVPSEDGRRFAESISARYYETSASRIETIEAVFAAAAAVDLPKRSSVANSPVQKADLVTEDPKTFLPLSPVPLPKADSSDQTGDLRANCRLSLSVAGLQRLEGLNRERDFVFIVGDEEYCCPSFIAEFLSPRITSLRSQDVTIQEFSIETADPNHWFKKILSIGFGREISFSKEELPFVRSVCGELWNSELFEKTLDCEKGEIKEDELMARLHFLSGVRGRWEPHIGVFASNFYKFSVSSLDQLNASCLESILSDSRLVLRDEDSLFELIHRRASEDSSYFRLLEFVRFEFVSPDCMMRALEFISDSFDELTFGIWSSLTTRLTLPVTAPRESLATSRFVVPPGPKREVRVLMLGLDGAGKTAILYKLKRDENTTPIPTRAFNVETVERNGVDMNIWELGGQERVRALWYHYFHRTQVLVFVVDSNDIGRLDEARDELHKLVEDPQLRDAILLVYANKQDLPNAIKPQELANRLQLNDMRNRVWKVQGSCVATGNGLHEGLDWAVTQLNERS